MENPEQAQINIKLLRHRFYVLVLIAINYFVYVHSLLNSI